MGKEARQSVCSRVVRLRGGEKNRSLEKNRKGVQFMLYQNSNAREVKSIGAGDERGGGNGEDEEDKDTSVLKMVLMDEGGR